MAEVSRLHRHKRTKTKQREWRLHSMRTIRELSKRPVPGIGRWLRTPLSFQSSLINKTKMLKLPSNKKEIKQASTVWTQINLETWFSLQCRPNYNFMICGRMSKVNNSIRQSPMIRYVPLRRCEMRRWSFVLNSRWCRSRYRWMSSHR